jgi:hypothetical protein
MRYVMATCRPIARGRAITGATTTAAVVRYVMAA